MTTDSYFKIINDVHEIESLEDTVRMFLMVSEGAGSFYSRKLDWFATERQTTPGTTWFANLDSQWYGVVLNQIIHNIENEYPEQTSAIDQNTGKEYLYESGPNGNPEDHSWEKVLTYD